MSFVKDFFNDITGRSGQVAARDASLAQVARGEEASGEVRGFGEQAQGFFDPFSGIAEQGVGLAQAFGDPQADFQFLQQNPLFQLALENANRQTGARAAAGGRLQAGDTLEQLSQNVLLSAQPLLSRRDQQTRDLLNLGFGVAGQQAGIAQGTGLTLADILTSIGATEAGGIVGQANARAQGTGNILNIAGSIAGGFGGFGGGTPTSAISGPQFVAANPLGPNFFGSAP